MEKNVGSVDKGIRIVAGVGIIAAGVVYGSWWGAIGLLPIATVLLSWCPAYALLGIKTCKTKGMES